VIPANSAAGNSTLPGGPPTRLPNTTVQPPVITVRASGPVPVTLNAGWLVSQVLSTIENALAGALTGAGDKLAWFATYLPTPSSLPVMSSVYSVVLEASLLLFALALIIQLTLAVMGKATFSPADPILSAIIMVFGLKAYSAMAALSSSFALYILNSNLGGASAAQMLVLEMAALSLTPGLNLLLLLALIEYATVAIIRILVTASLASSIPLFAVLWMVQPTRRIATDAMEGLFLLLLISPISAVMLSIGVGAALGALHGNNAFLDFALGTGTLLGISVLPFGLARGGVSAIEAGRSALRSRRRLPN